jgi:hypothetical protein
VTEESDKMDAAAKAAGDDLKTLPAENVQAVAAWWAKHYLLAGHKRLARTLLATTKKAPDEAG